MTVLLSRAGKDDPMHFIDSNAGSGSGGGSVGDGVDGATFDDGNNDFSNTIFYHNGQNDRSIVWWIGHHAEINSRAIASALP